jgi:hypothetical protein
MSSVLRDSSPIYDFFTPASVLQALESFEEPKNSSVSSAAGSALKKHQQLAAAEITLSKKYKQLIKSGTVGEIGAVMLKLISTGGALNAHLAVNNLIAKELTPNALMSEWNSGNNLQDQLLRITTNVQKCTQERIEALESEINRCKQEICELQVTGRKIDTRSGEAGNLLSSASQTPLLFRLWPQAAVEEPGENSVGAKHPFTSSPSKELLESEILLEQIVTLKEVVFASDESIKSGNREGIPLKNQSDQAALSWKEQSNQLAAILDKQQSMLESVGGRLGFITSKLTDKKLSDKEREELTYEQVIINAKRAACTLRLGEVAAALDLRKGTYKITEDSLSALDALIEKSPVQISATEVLMKITALKEKIKTDLPTYLNETQKSLYITYYKGAHSEINQNIAEIKKSTAERLIVLNNKIKENTSFIKSIQIQSVFLNSSSQIGQGHIHERRDWSLPKGPIRQSDGNPTPAASAAAAVFECKEAPSYGKGERPLKLENVKPMSAGPERQEMRLVNPQKQAGINIGIGVKKKEGDAST